ncbi:MAG: ParB/RepB/Spo0J family partition protein [Burkholderiales bacterium]
MALDLTALEDLAETVTGTSGAPLELPLDEVIEDPDQPRINFDEQALNELAKSIKRAGKVKTPISVKAKNADGKYIINDGARRFRASKLAGMATIRAFVDHEHDRIDQIIANLHKEDLTPFEIGDTLKAEMTDKGWTVAEISERTGKDASWVSRHLKIAGMSDELRPIAVRCGDYRAMASLVVAYEKAPALTIETFKDRESISRAQIDALSESIAASSKEKQSPEKAQPTKTATQQPGKPVQSASQPVVPEKAKEFNARVFLESMMWNALSGNEFTIPKLTAKQQKDVAAIILKWYERGQTNATHQGAIQDANTLAACWLAAYKNISFLSNSDLDVAEILAWSAGFNKQSMPSLDDLIRLCKTVEQFQKSIDDPEEE